MKNNKKISYWQPNHLLVKFLPYVQKGKVLDLGCGKGQNSFFLAENGFEVEAVDIDSIYIEDIEKITKKQKLKIDAFLEDIRKYEIKPQKYSLILAINSLIFLKKSEFKTILNKIKKDLKPEGIIIISGFTVHDPSFLKFQKTHSMIEKNTFCDKNNRYWQFLEKNELKNYFRKNFQTLYYREKIVKDRKPKFHYHGIAEIVVKKMEEKKTNN